MKLEHCWDEPILSEILNVQGFLANKASFVKGKQNSGHVDIDTYTHDMTCSTAIHLVSS